MSTESTLKIIFGGASHRRTSGYGWRVHPTKKTKKFHYGVDYGCGKVAVHALESGTVYKRGYDKSAGNYVYVKYARYGVCVAYFHLSKYFRKTGPGCKPWNQGRCCRIHRNIHWGTFTHRRS